MSVLEDIYADYESLKRAVQETISLDEVQAYIAVTNKFSSLRNSALSKEEYGKQVEQCIAVMDTLKVMPNVARFLDIFEKYRKAKAALEKAQLQVDTFNQSVSPKL